MNFVEGESLGETGSSKSFFAAKFLVHCLFVSSVVDLVENYAVEAVDQAEFLGLSVYSKGIKVFALAQDLPQYLTSW